MSSSARLPPRPGRLEAWLSLMPPRLVHVVTTPHVRGEPHPAVPVAGPGQKTCPGVTPLGVRRPGELIEGNHLRHPGAFHEPQALQHVQGGDHQVTGIPQEGAIKSASMKLV
jgi:hypothetical protein